MLVPLIRGSGGCNSITVKNKMPPELRPLLFLEISFDPTLKSRKIRMVRSLTDKLWLFCEAFCKQCSQVSLWKCNKWKPGGTGSLNCLHKPVSYWMWPSDWLHTFCILSCACSGMCSSVLWYLDFYSKILHFSQYFYSLSVNLKPWFCLRQF